jgi:hypothetical protein
MQMPRQMMVVVNMQWKIMTVMETAQPVKIVLVNAADQPWKMNAANVMVMDLKCVGMAVMSVMRQTAQMSHLMVFSLVLEILVMEH